ncbi:MAG: hypothetical protein K2K29_04590, partial [Muribaculaceae bacterium]|nr:hypothetical protein [Muribaculaceae bacterium]
MLPINRQTPTTILSLIFLLSIISAACRRTPEKINTQLDHAETIIESHPDSALSIIESIDTLQIHGKKDRARYSLLHTMALDKMLVDITDMNILTPALDYYISNGSPDQRMRTRYYEGVIRRAIGDDDGAMTCFLDAVSDTTKIYKDSLGLALVYLQQGALYYKQYRIDDFIKTTEKACSIYEAIDINNPNLILSYLKIIIGSNLNSYYSKADSIYNICLPLVKETSDDYQDLQNVHLISLIDRNDIPAIRQYLNSIVLDSIKSPLH